MTRSIVRSLRRPPARMDTHNRRRYGAFSHEERTFFHASRRSSKTSTLPTVESSVSWRPTTRVARGARPAGQPLLPAVAERVQRLERSGVITGYRAEIDPRMLGYQLTAIVRIKPAPGQLARVPELAARDSRDRRMPSNHRRGLLLPQGFLRAIDELGALLDRFLAHGDTTTSLIKASPIPGGIRHSTLKSRSEESETEKRRGVRTGPESSRHGA